MKSMRRYYAESIYSVHGTEYFGNIDGENGWSLVKTSATNDTASYRIFTQAVKIIPPYEHHYRETTNYYYAICETMPIFLFDIYAYVSKSEGGMMKFRDKYYYSGSAAGLGSDLHLKLADVSVGGHASFAMRVENIEVIVNEFIPGLDFKMKDGNVTVNWKDIIASKSLKG